MKRFVLLLLCVLTAFQVTACRSTEHDTDKLSIVTTLFPYYDFARNIAGDKAEVTLLLSPGAEAHSYEPSPRDIIQIKESDLFINTGMELDPWTDAVINDADGKKIRVVSAAFCVGTVYEEDEDDDHAEHDSAYHMDSHVWTSPKNAIKIVTAVLDALTDIDPDNREYYKKNADSYLESLTQLDRSFEKIVKESDKKTLAFADRFAMRYFAEDYKLDYFAAYPGCSGESEPSAARVAELIEIIKKEKTPVVFYTETSNGSLPDAVCQETGAKKMLFHSCHTVTKKQLDEGVTYIDLMQSNSKALKKALETKKQ